MSEKILQVSKILIQKKKSDKAIRLLYDGIKQDPFNAMLYSFLGDALKQCSEYDLALKMYQKALYLAEKQGNMDLIKELQVKIENIYIVNPQDAPNGPQIGFFIRTIMKMLSKMGKQDWF